MAAKTVLQRIVLLCAVSLLCGDLAHTAAHKRRRHRQVPPPAAADDDRPDGESANAEPSDPAKSEVHLKLVDGTRIQVDDAWESEQGFWYRQGGITHLVPRERAKGIEHGSTQVKPEPQVAKVTQVAEAQTSSMDGPAWIHLVGGARVEADSATESPSGVWYRRGTLSIFIERSRIDHIEREELAKNAASDTKKDRGWSTGSKRLDTLIKQNGARHGVDPYLVFLVMEQESHFNPRVVSPKGALGLMQLMPGTGTRFGVRRPFDPAQNISGGTRYLRQLLDRFSGRVDLALASYNAGEGAVIKFGHRVPPYRETRAYVKKIGYRYKHNKAPTTSNPPTASSSAAPSGN